MVLPKPPDITYEQVANKYTYDAETGELKRKPPTSQLRRKVGYTSPRGYKLIWLLGKPRSYHRIAWLLHYGSWPEEEIDHIDGNPQNNSIKNLRLVTRIENARNRKVSSNNKSGHSGVWWSNTEKRWIATIWYNKKQIQLGQFKNINDAINARKDGERQKYGEHARQPGPQQPASSQAGSDVPMGSGAVTSAISAQQAQLLSALIRGGAPLGGPADGAGSPPQSA